MFNCGDHDIDTNRAIVDLFIDLSITSREILYTDL